MSLNNTSSSEAQKSGSDKEKSIKFSYKVQVKSGLLDNAQRLEIAERIGSRIVDAASEQVAIELSDGETSFTHAGPSHSRESSRSVSAPAQPGSPSSARLQDSSPVKDEVDESDCDDNEHDETTSRLAQTSLAG